MIKLCRYAKKNIFFWIFGKKDYAAYKPNTKRIKLSKFQTKLVLFCTLHNIPPLSSHIKN